MTREQINEVLDSLPDEELEQAYWSIKFIQQAYLFKKVLLDKGVIITEFVEQAEEIKNLWESIFAKNISEEMRESIHYHQFKWHIFSYEQQDCLNEEAARKAFDVETKDELYIMYEGLPHVSEYSNAEKIVAADFDNQQDIYIVDKDFTWTYVHTHESSCGPYFYKVK